MTHFLQRSALIFLATSALCASPALARTHHGHAKKPAAAEVDQTERASYTVRKGDTLEKIAAKLGTSIDELAKANQLRKTSLLRPGQVLKGPAVAKSASRGESSKASSKSEGSKSAASKSAAGKPYVVVRGDTLFSISKRLHVSIDDLRQANGLSAKGQIHAGQELRLPGAEDAADEAAPSRSEKAAAASDRRARGRKGKAPPAEAVDEAPSTGDRTASGRVTTVQSRGETYKARKGDTLARIADKLDTDVSELKRLNHVRGSAVRAGQVFRGPSFTEHVYTASAGDTLASIAQRFGVSVERLRSENELSRRARSVRSGQKIYLPDGYRDHNAGPEPRPSRSIPQPYEPSRGDTSLPSHPLPYQPSGQTPRPYVPPAGSQTPPAETPSNTPALSDTQISQLAKGRFQWPLMGAILSDFGAKPGGQRNDGINIQAEAGAAVHAAADGEIIYAGAQVPGFGNLVLIKHADGWATVYAHLSHVDVKMQQKVTQGQQIGQAGDTGGVPEPQLHFEVRYTPNPAERARSVDPKLVLPK
jgi:murein DD-endopeptidase MepM/ murein hydrolase activator NlpD